MKVVLTITGSQRFGTDEPEKTSLVTEGTLEREGDILLLSYEESELTGMEGPTTVFRVEPARITLQRSGTLESQMVFELGHEDRSLYDMGFGALMITVLTDRLENTLTDAGGEMDVSYSVERSADIQPGIGTNALHGDRIAEGVVSGRGERAARLRLRDDIHNVCAGDGLALDDDGAVQMLAALRGQIQAVGREHAVQDGKDLLGDLRTGVRADAAAADLARGAANHDDLTGMQLCFFNQFFCGLFGLPADILKHGWVLLSYGPQDACGRAA